MLKITGSEDYYPTPEAFLEEITSGMNWDKVKDMLEPSAGSGNICDYARKMKGKWEYVDIDCVEIEPELRAILKDKGYRVVHDDFLTLHTYKHYDLIFMNPPFSQGARHLLKALDVQSRTGGSIICILNAETIRNAYSHERQALVQKLEQYGAEMKYYEGAFSVAENPTDVEVCVVKVTVPAPERQTTIFDTLREKDYEEFERKAASYELAELDFVKGYVALYNRELEWALQLYDEYLELQSKALDEKSLLQFCIGEGTRDREGFTVNGYVKVIRRKYWKKLFEHPEFTRRLTSNLYNQYISRINTFTDYDFSYWNIKTLQQEIARNLVRGVEECIIDLFDELSARHSWDSDMKNNIHYYNGWKTNLSWKINRRVIIPLCVWDYNGKLEYGMNMMNALSKLADIEKVLNYLDCGETRDTDEYFSVERYLNDGRTRNIPMKYFTVTFYKKGTCHITFTNERLLKKFNIFGSQKKGWLPKSYARRKYEELDPEEQAVIDSFEGQESYNDSVMESRYYLFEGREALPMLGSGCEENG